MKQYQEEMVLKRARAKANKHNWTMTKEMRGIITKPVLQKTKTQKRNTRRRARGGFKVNKSRVMKM